MRRATAWSGVAVSAVFVWIAVRDVDFGQVGAALRGASYWPIIPALLLLAVANVLRAFRWQALFDPRSRPPLEPIANAMLIGLLFNCILPSRAGEAARVVALWREAGTSRVESFATAVAERIYDVFALLVLLFLAEPFLPRVSWLGKVAAAAAVLAAGIVVTVVVLLRYRERPVVWALRRALSAERAVRMGASLVQGLVSFHHPAIALKAFVLTTASWLLLALSAWLLLLGFDFHVGFGAGLLVTIATTLVLVIPAAPGGVGQFEAGTRCRCAAASRKRGSAAEHDRMPDERPEIRTWLPDALARRTRHPALEDTLFHRLRELEQGPLEQLGGLVHQAIDELRVAQRRLAEQAGDVRALQQTVAALNDRVDALTEHASITAPVAAGHVLLLSVDAGYRLVEGDGPPPEDGAELEHEGRPYRVLNRGASPLPDDRRPCVLALPV